MQTREILPNQGKSNMAISPQYENPRRGTKANSKWNIKDTAQPPVRSGDVNKTGRGDQSGPGKGRSAHPSGSAENPPRVVGNLVKAGRRDQGQEHDDAD